MYAQLLNSVQISHEDVGGVLQLLTEEITAYPDIIPFSIFHRKIEVREIFGEDEISDK